MARPVPLLLEPATRRPRDRARPQPTAANATATNGKPMSDFGIASVHEGHASIRFERQLKASAEEVWTALTQPDPMSRWLGAEVRIQAEPGGAVQLRWPGGE